MSIQTSRRVVNKIDVGTPSPSSSTYKEWDAIEIHYHDFENLCQDADVSTDSPEFVCFGHKWCLQVYPGGRSGPMGLRLWLGWCLPRTSLK